MPTAIMASSARAPLSSEAGGLQDAKANARATMSSPAASCGGSARSPSPSVWQMNGCAESRHASASSGSASNSSISFIPPLHAPRPRRHIRSFSSEKRFNVGDKSHGDTSTSPAHETYAQQSSSPAATPSMGLFSPPPTRAKRSPSVESFAAAAAQNTSEPSLADRPPPPKAEPAQKGQLSESGKQNGSSPTTPPKAEAGSASADEREQVAKLRLAQASRRPRVQRLTPAFSSLPGRFSARPELRISESGQQAAITEGSGDSAGKVQFPSSGTSGEGAGLSIDLACIPSPSLNDLEGPVSTSRVETMVRDKNGNPIKPSLKNSRSGIVNQMLPGRSSRSDSTPSKPVTLSKSVPTTPTVAKNVKFDSHLEHVKLFKNRQRPTAVSRDGSPEQTETETEEEKEMYPYIWTRSSHSPPGAAPSPGNGATDSAAEEQLVLRLPNFPSSTRLSTTRPVFLERIYLSDDLRSVKGTVQVRNMSFEKWVAIRYSLDHWVTIGEVSADYQESIKAGQADRFSFSIKLNELLNWPRGSALQETKSMFLCVRYNTSGQEFWDNNDNLNYQLDFRRRPLPTTPASTPATGGATRSSAQMATANGSRKARVLQMARNGVGGKGMFAMEELRRELEKLRSDDEAETALQRVQALASEARARHRTVTAVAQSGSPSASPPKSPDARSASPSLWSARYDFGRSLRDSKGGRAADDGRAGVPDYFSHRQPQRGYMDVHSPDTSRSGLSTATSMARSSSSQNAATSPLASLSIVPTKSKDDSAPAFTVSAASPQNESQEFSEIPSYQSLHAGAFNARFGMFSPGIDQPIRHMPVGTGSGTPSAANSPSPSVTPSMAVNQSNSSASSSTAVSPEQFYSFSSDGGHRHALSVPASGTILHQRTSSNSSSTNSSPMSSQRNSVTTLSMNMYDSADTTSTRSSPSSPPPGTEDSSPPSDGGSPNPFSPTVSISSNESDATTASSDSKSTVTPHSSKTARPSTLGHIRPHSMSDYNEIISRYCWNAESVPSGGSMHPSVPTHGGLGKASVVIDGQPGVARSLAPAIDPLPHFAAKRSDASTAYDFNDASSTPRMHTSDDGASGSGSGSSTPTRS